MRTIGSYEAKTHLPKLLDSVAKGERITITKHGNPVAMLVPVQTMRRSDPEVTICELRKFRKRLTLGELSLRAMIEEGRKF